MSELGSSKKGDAPSSAQGFFASLGLDHDYDPVEGLAENERDVPAGGQGPEGTTWRSTAERKSGVGPEEEDYSGKNWLEDA